jgi:hypothetical protein
LVCYTLVLLANSNLDQQRLSWSCRDGRDLRREAVRRQPQVFESGADERAAMHERQLDAHL